MIHYPRVVKRIAELIKLAGVSSDAMIEEMTDHYLTEIEYAVGLGSSEQKAIRDTYQNIAQTDLKSIDQRGNKTKWLFGALALVLLIFIVTFQFETTRDPISIADKESIALPNGWPIKSDINHIASGFGVKFHPISNTKIFHKGIDIKASTGTEVLATGDGLITESGYNHSSGYYIIVRHNDQYSTRYLHLSKLEITDDQKVKKGDIIGLVGNSGISLNPHLHYEVIKNEIVVDPLEVIAP